MNKVLFWDFDGTLSYPNKSFFDALDKALLKSGYSFENNKAEEFLKTAYSWKTPHITYVDKTNSLWWDMLFEKIKEFCTSVGVAPSDLEKVCTDFKEILTDVSNYKLYSDTKETLEKCMDLGYKNYLITNNYPEITDILEKLGISQFFENFIVSSHIGYEKPRKEFFEHAVKSAENPDDVYVIGDNPEADIKGGKNMGFKTIAVHECVESEADYYLKNLNDIFKILISNRRSRYENCNYN